MYTDIEAAGVCLVAMFLGFIMGLAVGNLDNLHDDGDSENGPEK